MTAMHPDRELPVLRCSIAKLPLSGTKVVLVTAAHVASGYACRRGE
jgi:hypothetical protein